MVPLQRSQLGESTSRSPFRRDQDSADASSLRCHRSRAECRAARFPRTCRPPSLPNSRRVGCRCWRAWTGPRIVVRPTGHPGFPDDVRWPSPIREMVPSAPWSRWCCRSVTCSPDGIGGSSSRYRIHGFPAATRRLTSPRSRLTSCRSPYTYFAGTEFSRSRSSPAPRSSPERNVRACTSMDLAPRRGFPHPLWSAFAVSHDPGGLLLSEPSGVFQPVTLVEFGLRWHHLSTSSRSPASRGLPAARVPSEFALSPGRRPPR